jgi:hypothetical protein
MSLPEVLGQMAHLAVQKVGAGSCGGADGSTCGAGYGLSYGAVMTVGARKGGSGVGATDGAIQTASTPTDSAVATPQFRLLVMGMTQRWAALKSGTWVGWKEMVCTVSFRRCEATNCASDSVPRAFHARSATANYHVISCSSVRPGERPNATEAPADSGAVATSKR